MGIVYRNCVFVVITYIMMHGRGATATYGEEVFLGLAEFKEKIATSEEWINLWRIEIGQPTERIRRKIKAKWTERLDGTILRNTVTCELYLQAIHQIRVNGCFQLFLVGGVFQQFSNDGGRSLPGPSRDADGARLQDHSGQAPGG